MLIKTASYFYVNLTQNFIINKGGYRLISKTSGGKYDSADAYEGGGCILTLIEGKLYDIILTLFNMSSSVKLV